MALGAPGLDAAGLRAVAEWPPLSALSATAATVTLSALGDAPALRAIEGLVWSGRDEGELALLARWPGLRRLRLRGRLPRGSLAHVAGGLSRLVSLHLDWCSDLGDDDLRGLAPCSALQSLRLSNAQRLADLSSLSALSGLRRLAVSARWSAPWEPAPLDDLLTDAGVAKLSAPGLEELSLVGFRAVTGSSLEPSALPRLRRLFLPLASREGARRVAALPSLQHLDAHSSPTTPAMLDELGRCGSLRSALMKRSKSRFERAGSTAVIPSAKHTALLAALPRPWHKMLRLRAISTISQVDRKYGATPKRAMSVSSFSIWSATELGTPSG